MRDERSMNEKPVTVFSHSKYSQIYRPYSGQCKTKTKIELRVQTFKVKSYSHFHEHQLLNHFNSVNSV